LIDLNYVTVEMKINNDSALVILLHKDGTINRSGNGSAAVVKNFFIGITDTAKIMEELSKLVDADFEQHLNMVYDDPAKTGKTCSVEIVLDDEKGVKGTRFSYGSESMGPPREIANFVLKAIDLTDPWYLPQLKKITRSQKKWWQVWK
jgi:hypothetical protein